MSFKHASVSFIYPMTYIPLTGEMIKLFIEMKYGIKLIFLAVFRDSSYSLTQDEISLGKLFPVVLLN